jgi:VWFA-related protein
MKRGVVRSDCDNTLTASGRNRWERLKARMPKIDRGKAPVRAGAESPSAEKQEEVVSSRPAAVLGRLANETGGFLIDNSNDLGKGVARIQVERTTYYLLGYQPTNAALDGKFRKVTVKVKRGKYVVRARPGYVAPSR